MKRNTGQVVIAVVAFSILCVTAGTRASAIELTEEVVTRYIATCPEIRDLTHRLEEIGKLPESDENTKKTLEIIAKKEELLKAKGWADFWEYMDAMGRITEGVVPLYVLEKFAHSPEQKRRQAMDLVMAQLKEKGFSEEEIGVLIKHLASLKKLLGGVTRQ